MQHLSSYSYGSLSQHMSVRPLSIHVSQNARTSNEVSFVRGKHFGYVSNQTLLQRPLGKNHFDNWIGLTTTSKHKCLLQLSAKKMPYPKTTVSLITPRSLGFAKGIRLMTRYLLAVLDSEIFKTLTHSRRKRDLRKSRCWAKAKDKICAHQSLHKLHESFERCAP